MNLVQSQKNRKKAKRHPWISGSTWGWLQKALALIIFSLVINHLANPDSFPDGDSYRFPKEGVIASIILYILIGIIAHLNFKRYKKKHFSKKVEISSIGGFMLSTLGYITVMYIPLNIILNKIVGAETEFYLLLIGLLITLLISAILIGLWYAQDIYTLYAHSLKDAEITIESGAKMKNF